MNSGTFILSSVAFILLAASQITSVADWPSWRGPKGDGSSEGPLPILKWSATENVKWKAPLPERGNGSPIVTGQKVLITQAIEGENSRMVVCFDRSSGKELWRAGTVYAEPEASHDTNPQGSSSPVTDGERVIAWFGSAGLFCFDLNGKELWRRDLGKHQHDWGYGASPLLHGGVCYLNFGPGKKSLLIALDKTTGATLWQNEIPEPQPTRRTDGFAGNLKNGRIGSWSSPLMVKSGDHEELVMSYPETIRAYHPKTGAELWRCEGLNPLVYASTLAQGDIVVGMGGFTGNSIAVRAGGKGDVTESRRMWMIEKTANRCGTGVIHGDHIYVVNMNGVAECLELKTGARVWQERLPAAGAKGDTWAASVLAGDRVYNVNQSGDVIVFKASPKFEILSVNSVGAEISNSTVAIADGEVFLRTHNHLWCFSDTRKAALR